MGWKAAVSEIEAHIEAHMEAKMMNGNEGMYDKK
jgi:hypothetical protein